MPNVETVLLVVIGLVVLFVVVAMLRAVRIGGLPCAQLLVEDV